MRLGGPIFEKYDTAEEWVAILRRAGFRAALCEAIGPLAPVLVELAVQDREQGVVLDPVTVVLAKLGQLPSPFAAPPPFVRAKMVERQARGARLPGRHISA